uniref:Uncharacterized protein n=1 Tax=viral metagenome TaxID=1070528 RepID=A0A6C0JWJ6_9ZZZZ
MNSLEDRFCECDSVVKSTVMDFIGRSEVGRKKYGATMDRSDLTPVQWLQHAKEELMDMLLYMGKLQFELERIEKHSKDHTYS